MKKIKILLSTIALCFAVNASADCVVTSEFLTAKSLKEATPNIGCDVNAFVKDRTLRRFDPIQTFQISIENTEVTKIDLSDLDSGLEYVLNFTDSTNLEKLEIGKITVFNTLSVKGTKIADLRFLEEVTRANIFIDKVSHYPNPESPFCEAVKLRHIEITPEHHRTTLDKACDIERD